MKIYHVQLETPDSTYRYEVYTDDFDAVERARASLGQVIGMEAAQAAHVGGYDQVGEDPEVTSPKVSIDALTVHHLIQDIADKVL